MENKSDKKRSVDLPACVTEFIRQVVRQMGYRRKARREVEAELTAHFEDELRGLTDAKEREQKAQRLIEQFGDAKLIAILCRRAKKRCRPPWAKAMVRVLQAAGIFLVLLGLYLIWFVSGRPAVKVDYLAVLNRMSRPEIMEQDNAWPHYEKAIGLVVEPGPELQELPLGFRTFSYPEHQDFAGLSEEMQAAVEDWLQANRPAWEEFVLAASKPYLYRPYECPSEANEPWLLSMKVPELSSLRHLAFVGIWSSRLAMAQGNTGGALEDSLVVARAGRHWQHAELLIEQLLGLAMSNIAHAQILLIAERQDLSGAALADLQRRIANIYPESYPLIDLEAERLAFLDTVQHIFTDKGPGGGHLVPSAMASISSTAEFGDILETPLGSTALSLIHAGRDETVAAACRVYDHQKELAPLSPYQRRDRRVAAGEDMVESLPKYRYALIDLMLPELHRIMDRRFQGRAMHEATLVILALQRYHREKGQYPASLTELMQAGYITSLPADPYGDRPLSYKVTNGTFVLYSVGPNFEDDGGVMGTDRKGRPRLWGDSDVDVDAVFWPISP